MEVHGEPQSSPSSTSSRTDGSGASVSKELLAAGSGGRGGDRRVAAAWGAHVRRGAGRSLPRTRTPGSSPRRVRRAPACPPPCIWDRLLINSKTNSKKNPTLQTVRIERSPLLDQVQSFLPQMAQANEKLRKEIAAAPPGRFNIENIDETLGEVIQMDVALFEMNQSDSKEEDSSEESSQDSSADGSESEDEDDSSDSEVTIDNIKLPHSEDGKGKIEVLDSPASERKEIHRLQKYQTYVKLLKLFHTVAHGLKLIKCRK
ncbi:hypothetical protein HPG69_001137 [Diceros bicornis minor]|uniref:Uncharacterized protein n=1 Tax=Diceros bicornis minor TaxID=77932 RepID=A0A7J7FER6_DICBM|nr:hypothetical protein HPG69_001137 [Diceros bicornis minor]